MIRRACRFTDVLISFSAVSAMTILLSLQLFPLFNRSHFAEDLDQ
jgi:hypothetical protein